VLLIHSKKVLGIRYITATAIISHLLCLSLPMFDTVGKAGDQISVLQAIIEIPIAMAIESLTLLSAVVYWLVMIYRKRPRTETIIGVFNGSLALSLSAPALLMPLAGTKVSQENWLFQNPLNIAFNSTLVGFWAWIISISMIGISIHLVTVTRWKRLAYHGD
jgi:hypothetical protein